MNSITSGAIAGALATAPMTVVMRGLHPILPPEEQRPLPPEEITAVFARKAGLDAQPQESGWEWKTYLGHFSYGALAGAGYEVVRSRLPGPPVVQGTLYGLGVWFGSYLGWLPVANVYPPASQDPPKRNLLMIGAHIVWGAATGLIQDRLARSSKEVGNDSA